MTDWTNLDAEPMEAAPAAPVPAPARSIFSRVAIAGGSLLLGGAVIAAALAGPTALASSGSLVVLPNSATGSLADISTGTSSGPGGWGPGDCDRDGSSGTAIRGDRPMKLLGPHHADELAAAANALGLSASDLTTRLQGGTTLAEIAKTQGVDVQAVVDALVAVEKSEIAAAVTAGRITQEQADKMTAHLTQRLTELVNGTFRGSTGGPGHHRHGGFGPSQPAPEVSGGSVPTAPSGTPSAPSA